MTNISVKLMKIIVRGVNRHGSLHTVSSAEFVGGVLFIPTPIPHRGRSTN
jgi:hypothetical protein